jgi:hypothetical protein
MVEINSEFSNQPEIKPLTDGQRKHFRKELSAVRRNGSPTKISQVENNIGRLRKAADRIARETQQARGRVEEIDTVLRLDFCVFPYEREELTVERMWWMVKLAPPETKMSKLQEIELYLNEIEMTNPEAMVHLNTWVSKQGDHYVSLLMAIRDRVLSQKEFC